MRVNVESFLNSRGHVLVKIVEKLRGQHWSTGRGPGPTLFLCQMAFSTGNITSLFSITHNRLNRGEVIRLDNIVLALLSQYACCHMGLLIVKIVGNINEFLTACISLTVNASPMEISNRRSRSMSMPKIKVLGQTVAAGDTGTDRQMET